MTRDQFESAVRSLNERYDGADNQLHEMVRAGEITPDQRQRFSESDKREHWTALRTLCNKYLYGVNTPFIYYPTLDAQIEEARNASGN